MVTSSVTFLLAAGWVFSLISGNLLMNSFRVLSFSSTKPFCIADGIAYMLAGLFEAMSWNGRRRASMLPPVYFRCGGVTDRVRRISNEGVDTRDCWTGLLSENEPADKEIDAMSW